MNLDGIEEFSGAGEVAQQLRALAALPEDPCFALSTHMGQAWHSRLRALHPLGTWCTSLEADEISVHLDCFLRNLFT